MSVSETSLTVERKKMPGIQALGIAGIIGAPGLFLQFIFEDLSKNSLNINNKFIAVWGIIYIAGWICGVVGLNQLRINSGCKSGKVIFILQLLLLCFALLFSVLDTFGFNHENGGWLFAICDVCYPLSHLFMIVTGTFIWMKGILRGIQKFAPFIVGFSLPLTLVLGAIVGMKTGVVFFGIFTTIGLGMIGYVVSSNEE